MPKILTQLVTSTISSITASTGAAAGGSSNIIEVTTQAQASQLAANIKNSFVNISGIVTITGTTFENCKISIKDDTTFSSCSIIASAIGNSDKLFLTSSDVTFDNTTVNSSSISGCSIVSFSVDSGNAIDLHAVDIPTSYTKTFMKVWNDASSLSLLNSNIKGSDLELVGYNLSVSNTSIACVDEVKLSPLANNEVSLGSNVVISAKNIYSDSFFATEVHNLAILNSKLDLQNKTLLLKKYGSTDDIITLNSGLHPAYKVTNQEYNAISESGIGYQQSVLATGQSTTSGYNNLSYSNVSTVQHGTFENGTVNTSNTNYSTTATGVTRFTFDTAGIYVVEFISYAQSSSGGFQFVDVVRNGSTSSMK